MSFGEEYERFIRDEWADDDRIHVSTIPKKPTELRVGEWVMYLPMDITTQMGLSPKMARIQRIDFRENKFFLTTTLGLMIFEPVSLIQVVT